MWAKLFRKSFVASASVTMMLVKEVCGNHYPIPTNSTEKENPSDELVSKSTIGILAILGAGILILCCRRACSANQAAHDPILIQPAPTVFMSSQLNRPLFPARVTRAQPAYLFMDSTNFLFRDEENPATPKNSLN